MNQHLYYAGEDRYQLRDWGGYLCFLATDAIAGVKHFSVTAVVRMNRLIHDPHVHDDSDEIFYVLKGRGRQLLRNADGTDTVYDIAPGDTVYLTKNRWHGTSNFSPEEQLDMLLINYVYDGQSSPNIKGVVPADSVNPEKTPYGSRAQVISPQPSEGKNLIGEVLTILPGKQLSGTVDDSEEFFFNVSGAAQIAINGDAAQPFPVRTQAFFLRGDSFRIENASREPVRLFCLRAQ